MPVQSETRVPVRLRTWFVVLLCAALALLQSFAYERVMIRTNNDIVTRVSHSSDYVKKVLQQQIPAMYYATEHGTQTTSADTKGWMRITKANGALYERSFGGDHVGPEDLVQNHRQDEDIAYFTFAIGSDGKVVIGDSWTSPSLRDVRGDISVAIRSGLTRLWSTGQTAVIEGALVVQPIRIERVQVYDPGADVFRQVMVSMTYVYLTGAFAGFLYGFFAPYKKQRETSIGDTICQMPLEVGLIFYPLVFFAILFLLTMALLWSANLTFSDFPYHLLTSRSFFYIAIGLGAFQSNLYGYMLAVLVKSFRRQGFLKRSIFLRAFRKLAGKLGYFFRFDIPVDHDYELYLRIAFWAVLWMAYLLLIEAPYLPLALLGLIVLIIMKVRNHKQLDYLDHMTQKMVEGDYETAIDLDRAGAYKSTAQRINHLSQGMKQAVDDQVRNERLKTELISNVSHDLRTPLTAIINYSDLLQNPDLDEQDRQAYAAVVHKKTVRLQVLMDDLLEVTKTTSGVVDLDLVDLDLKALVRQAFGEYEDRLVQKGLILVQDWSEGPMPCTLDGRKTSRVFDNLISNLIKYALAGTRVYVTGRLVDGWAEVVIKNVANYPMNYDASRMLERFVRGDRSRSTEGSGLGLAIAQDLIDLQGGKFDLEVDGDLFKSKICFKVSHQDQDESSGP